MLVLSYKSVQSYLAKPDVKWLRMLRCSRAFRFHGFFASRQVSNGSRSVRAKAISMILRLRRGVVRSEGLDPNAASEDGRVRPAIQIQLSNGGEGAHPYSSDVKRPSFASSFTHFESRRRGAAGCRRWVERWLDYRALAERLRAADVHDLDHQGTVR